ncbi:hypothetical protein G3T14_12325 [Methylobacterium sp. BTF04]|uniref:hypothetical protein n=1 Tax=Methylobacterium sp. BTF04 TaxID=2708300 RepID=UPI0013CF4827|nr:hypothetical protein [Methylobacterium sp. BTF04]NEU12919.1 hypothetical protein [Methylobacterium sp. BTF04]
MSNINPTNLSARDNLKAFFQTRGGQPDAPGIPSPTKEATAGVSSAPATVVDLSDRAKAMLKRNEADQVVADRLAEQITSAKSDGRPGVAGRSEQGQSKSPTLDDILGGGSSSKAAAGSPQGLNYRSERIEQLRDASRQADGSVRSFSVTESNVFEVPTSSAEINDWYDNTGKSLVELAYQHPDGDVSGIGSAIQSKTVKILNAKDIPGLNFANTINFSGGEGGAQVNDMHSYNRDAEIFKDPNINYQVSSNRTVLAWPKSVSY